MKRTTSYVAALAEDDRDEFLTAFDSMLERHDDTAGSAQVEIPYRCEVHVLTLSDASSSS